MCSLLSIINEVQSLHGHMTHLSSAAAFTACSQQGVLACNTPSVNIPCVTGGVKTLHTFRHCIHTQCAAREQHSTHGALSWSHILDRQLSAMFWCTLSCAETWREDCVHLPAPPAKARSWTLTPKGCRVCVYVSTWPVSNIKLGNFTLCTIAVAKTVMKDVALPKTKPCCFNLAAKVSCCWRARSACCCSVYL